MSRYSNGYFAILLGATLIVGGAASANDSDNDGIDDDMDNCVEVANPIQRDTDSDNIGNLCDPDIAQPNDCVINFPDLNVMKAAFFSNLTAPNWNADADLDGDDTVNFADLQIVKDAFFGEPGPSGLPSVCMPLGEGEICDPGASFCASGLSCCYPCGVPGCNNICVIPCDPGNPFCVDGCLLGP